MKHIQIITCKMILEEVETTAESVFGAGGYCLNVVEPGLHQSPDLLRARLQQMIASMPAGSTVYLVMGRCGGATIGLNAGPFALVIPKVDDCIGILLGSREAFLFQSSNNPGTYYLSKGWVLYSETPEVQLETCVKRHSYAMCKDAVKSIYRHYTRVLFIHTGVSDDREAMRNARKIAKNLGLRFEETQGSTALIERLLSLRPHNPDEGQPTPDRDDHIIDDHTNEETFGSKGGRCITRAKTVSDFIIVYPGQVLSEEKWEQQL